MNFFPPEKLGGDFPWERRLKRNCGGSVLRPFVVPLKNSIRSNERVQAKITGVGGGGRRLGSGIGEKISTKRNIDFSGRTESRPLAVGFVPGSGLLERAARLGLGFCLCGDDLPYGM